LYGKVEDSFCNLCGRAEEDVFHVLIECCHYSGPRRKYLGNLICNTRLTRYNYLSLFNELTEEEIGSLSKFFFIVCEIRMFSYSQMGIELS
jgi:hypothetical protein